MPLSQLGALRCPPRSQPGALRCPPLPARHLALSRLSPPGALRCPPRDAALNIYTTCYTTCNTREPSYTRRGCVPEYSVLV
eukprot:3438774-Pleurochrysis_carterae.AAC.1